MDTKPAPSNPAEPKPTSPRLTIAEVAAEMHVSGRYVRGLITSGRLREIRVSRKVRFVDRADLERFLKSCKAGSAA